MSNNFSLRFEIIYKKYYDWGIQNGFKPSKLGFSRFMGLSQGAIQKWEKGQIPAAKDIKVIHEKLGFAYNWLISGEGEMFDKTPELLKELKEKDAEITRLKTRLFMEGSFNEESARATVKVGEQK